ncbi:TPA: D-glycero-beta-D-manno-heptose 1-phosphate adenylyltransferase [bacterium]|nr:D-glycero-beta-D-manno-heptose 1-phosphate adenylyltransferase [bacterium]
MKLREIRELKAIVESLKKKGKKIVFTNGCFDILHPGHIYLLKTAKSYGDVLIVGLNSDSSISKIKPNRPILPQSARIEVLSSIAMVDYIVVFDDETPLDLIKEIGPNILVKGGDWKEDEVVGRDFADCVKIIDYIPGWSTSGIIEKIKKEADLF